MPEFTVIWEIDIEAETHEEAARKARAIQLDPASVADVFEVHHPMPGVMSKRVDLSELNDHPGGTEHMIS